MRLSKRAVPAPIWSCSRAAPARDGPRGETRRARATCRRGRPTPIRRRSGWLLSNPGSVAEDPYPFLALGSGRPGAEANGEGGGPPFFFLFHSAFGFFFSLLLRI